MTAQGSIGIRITMAKQTTNDLDRTGVFQQMGFVGVGDPYKDNQESELMSCVKEFLVAMCS